MWQVVPLALVFACVGPGPAGGLPGPGGTDGSATDSGLREGETGPHVGGGTTETPPFTANAPHVAMQLRAALVSAGCVAAGEAVPEHAPSMYRGFLAPAGGGLYDPRLAGCVYSATRGDFRTESTYDAFGRPTRVVTSEGETHYTWGANGCRELVIDAEGVSGWGLACDDHGYPICASRNGRDGITVTRFTNTYEDDGTLAGTTYPYGFWQWYTWEDGRVVEISVRGDHTSDGWSETWEWERERPVRYRKYVVDWPEYSDWTYDEGGRVATVYGSSDEGTYVYDGNAEWPSSLVDASGRTVATFAVDCPAR